MEEGEGGEERRGKGLGRTAEREHCTLFIAVIIPPFGTTSFLPFFHFNHY